MFICGIILKQKHMKFLNEEFKESFLEAIKPIVAEFYPMSETLHLDGTYTQSYILQNVKFTFNGQNFYFEFYLQDGLEIECIIVDDEFLDEDLTEEIINFLEN